MKKIIAFVKEKRINQKGETLVEVVVSLCVFAVMISLVAMNFYTASAIVKNTIKDSINSSEEYVDVAHDVSLKLVREDHIRISVKNEAGVIYEKDGYLYLGRNEDGENYKKYTILSLTN